LLKRTKEKRNIEKENMKGVYRLFVEVALGEIADERPDKPARPWRPQG